MRLTRINLARLSFGLALGIAIVGCATSVNPVSGRVDRGLMSEQEEIASGRSIHQQVLREYPAYKDAALQSYVNGVGQKLAAQSHRNNLPWTFTVVDSPEINAFAVQGGFIYMTRGLMAYLDSEAELAGVLGHEIGHVTARHGARAARDQQIAAGTQLLGTLIGADLGGEAGANVGSQVTGTYAQAGFLLPRSREHELQADELGAEYMQRVGFDPDLMEKVISVLKAQEKFANGEAQRSGRPTGDTPNWLRTHPSNDQRLAEVRRIANQYSGKYQDAGRARYLQAINGMTFGDSREQGVIRGQDFYHEPLGFTLRTPLNWSIQNATSELSIVADNMQAAVSLRPSPNSKGDHAAAIRSLLQPDQGRTEATKINGLRATNFLGTKQGSPVEATVISLGGADYVFQKLQKPAARGTYDRELREIVASFRALTPADASNAKPYTIRVVVAPRTSAPFTDLAQEVSQIAPQYRNAEAQLRLLNQAYPQGNISAGQLVKTIQ
jgi:predicted Zn-dependent protease